MSAPGNQEAEGRGGVSFEGRQGPLAGENGVPCRPAPGELSWARGLHPKPKAGAFCHQTCGLSRDHLSVFVEKVSSWDSRTSGSPVSAPERPHRQTSFARESSRRNRTGKAEEGLLRVGVPACCPRPGPAAARTSRPLSPASVCCPDQRPRQPGIPPPPPAGSALTTGPGASARGQPRGPRQSPAH